MSDPICRIFSQQLDRIQTPQYQRSVSFGMSDATASHSRTTGSSVGTEEKRDTAHPTVARQLHRANRRDMDHAQRLRRDKAWQKRKQRLKGCYEMEADVYTVSFPSADSDES